MKTIIFELKEKEYEVVYDDEHLDEVVKRTGILPEEMAECIKDLIVYYLVFPSSLKMVYEKVAKERGMPYNTLVTYVRKSINEAIDTGEMGNIYDYAQGLTYDCDYGLTNKEYIAAISDYLLLRGYAQYNEIINAE